MKKLLTIILALVVTLVSVVGCSNDDPNNGNGGGASITLSKTTVSLPISGETTVSATLEGEGEITWTNSNDSVVSIVPSGNSVQILGVKTGTAEVVAKSGDAEATCYVTVTSLKVELALYLGVESVEIRNGGSLYVPATTVLENNEVDGATYNYEIEDTDIATVQNGVVTGVAVGETVLNVSASYDGRVSNVVSVPVIVKSGSVLLVNSAAVTLYDLEENGIDYPVEKEITVKISNGTTASEVTYSATSDDENVATIEGGVIKAVGVGETRINISCSQSGTTYTASVYVRVKPAPMVVFMFENRVISLYTVEEGRPIPTYQLNPDIYIEGKDVEVNNIEYSLVDGSVISVTESGLITSLSAQGGSAKVQAKFTFQGKEYTEIVDVVTAMDTTLYYGNHIETEYQVPGMVARMTEGDTIMYYNIDFDNNKDTSLVRFQVIQDQKHEGESYKHPYGAKNIFITLQDAANPSNYLTVLVGTLEVEDQYYAYGAKIGARVSSWVSYEVGSKDEVFYALKSGSKPIGVDTQGWVGYNYGINGWSFYNWWLDKVNATIHHDGSDLRHQMFSIGVQDKSVYFHINNSTVELLNMSDKVSGQDPWSGFSGDKLNVFVTTTGYNGAEQTHLVFDTLGGKTVTASMKNGFAVRKLGTSLIPLD